MPNEYMYSSMSHAVFKRCVISQKKPYMDKYQEPLWRHGHEHQPEKFKKITQAKQQDIEDGKLDMDIHVIIADFHKSGQDFQMAVSTT